MFDELLKLPGVENASGALLWFITIAAVIIASLPHIVTLVNQGKDAKKERRAESEQVTQAKINQFDSVSAAEARFRTDALAELEKLRGRFSALEDRHEKLREQNDTLLEQNEALIKQNEILQSQNVTLQRQLERLQGQYDTLLAKTEQSQKTLEKIERNTESG